MELVLSVNKCTAVCACVGSIYRRRVVSVSGDGGGEGEDGPRTVAVVRPKLLLLLLLLLLLHLASGCLRLVR